MRHGKRAGGWGQDQKEWLTCCSEEQPTAKAIYSNNPFARISFNSNWFVQGQIVDLTSCLSLPYYPPLLSSPKSSLPRSLISRALPPSLAPSSILSTASSSSWHCCPGEHGSTCSEASCRQYFGPGPAAAGPRARPLTRRPSTVSPLY
eukprot:203485-Hanusia_phi.AAC.4